MSPNGREALYSNIANHLEFHGYAVTQRDEMLMAVHPRLPNVAFRAYADGGLLSASYGGSDVGHSDRAAFLTWVNSLNVVAQATRYYVDGDGDLMIEAWYPGEYDRQRFGYFLGRWDSDIARFITQARESPYLR